MGGTPTSALAIAVIPFAAESKVEEDLFQVRFRLWHGWMLFCDAWVQLCEGQDAYLCERQILRCSGCLRLLMRVEVRQRMDEERS